MKGLLEAMKGLLEAMKGLLDAMKGLLELILSKGTDPIQLSFLAYHIEQKRKIRDRMVRDLEDELRESCRPVAASTGSEVGSSKPASQHRPGSPRKQTHTPKHRSEGV